MKKSNIQPTYFLVFALLFTALIACNKDEEDNAKNYPDYSSSIIKETPRIAEHCIAHTFKIEWPKSFPDRKVNTVNFHKIIKKIC